MSDLFPETLSNAPHLVGTTGPAPKWESELVDAKWGHPRIVVRLLPRWSTANGWVCGWFANVDNAVDEWMPGAAVRPNWPWYRPDTQPQSNRFEYAAASAARAVKIVLEQMIAYAELDAAPAVREISERIEVQARTWLLGEAP